MTLARKNNRTSLRNINASERRALFERARDINGLRTATELLDLTCDINSTSLSFHFAPTRSLVLALPNGRTDVCQLSGSVEVGLVSPDFFVLAEVFARSVFPERQHDVTPVENRRPIVGKYSATMTFEADSVVDLVRILEDARAIGLSFDVAIRQHPALQALALLSTLHDTSEGAENLRRVSECYSVNPEALSSTDAEALRSRALTFLRADTILTHGMSFVETRDFELGAVFADARRLLRDVVDAIRQPQP